MNQVIIETTPVLRRAEFTMPKRAIKKSTALKIAKIIQKDWVKNTNKFILDLNCHELKATQVENEQVKVEEEADTAIVVNYPKINIHHLGLDYVVRNSTAVCYKDSSTKNWTKVSLKNYNSVALDKVDEVRNQYDIIADICCVVNQNIFIEILNKIQHDNPEHIGTFKILTFGVKDEKLGKILDKFDDNELKLKNLFTKEAEAKKIITHYYKELFNKRIIAKSTETDYWVTALSNVITLHDYIVNSNVLFNIKIKDNIIEANGIGFDETKTNDLAAISSLQLARLYAHDI